MQHKNSHDIREPVRQTNECLCDAGGKRQRGREKYLALSGPCSLTALHSSRAIIADRSKAVESRRDKPIRATHFVWAARGRCLVRSSAAFSDVST